MTNEKYNIKDLLEMIQENVTYKDNKIKYLETENKLLHDNAYKDIQIENMQNKLNYMTDEYNRGFPVTKEEQVKIKEWIAGHGAICDKVAGAIGGQFDYIFTPTSVGVLGKIQCSKCKENFIFKDL